MSTPAIIPEYGLLHERCPQHEQVFETRPVLTGLCWSIVRSGSRNDCAFVCSSILLQLTSSIWVIPLPSADRDWMLSSMHLNISHQRKAAVLQIMTCAHLHRLHESVQVILSLPQLAFGFVLLIKPKPEGSMRSAAQPVLSSLLMRALALQTYAQVAPVVEDAVNKATPYVKTAAKTAGDIAGPVVKAVTPTVQVQLPGAPATHHNAVPPTKSCSLSSQI